MSAETGEVQADPRDIRILADDRDALKKQLGEVRESHRQVEAVARRVPHLEGDLARAERERDRAKEKANASAAEAGELEERNRVLEAKLRGEEDLERERDEALAQVEEARAAQEKAEGDRDILAGDVESLQTTLANARKEIQRLQAHERHTRLVRSFLDQTKELT